MADHMEENFLPSPSTVAAKPKSANVNRSFLIKCIDLSNPMYKILCQIHLHSK